MTRLKENIWTVLLGEPQSYIDTTTGSYHLDTDSALVCLAVRSHCTGHNDTTEIARRAGLPLETVTAALGAFADAGLIITGDTRTPTDPDTVRAALVAVTNLWANELARSYIGNRFAQGVLTHSALVGWLIETYHYIAQFPATIRHAAAAAHGQLRDVLSEYSHQETGHQKFVLDTLERLGISPTEVITSWPLLSTRAIAWAMRDLIDVHPVGMLAVAALVEAQEHDETATAGFAEAIEKHYGIDATAWDPYFAHQKIDHELGHAHLLTNHLELVDIADGATLDWFVNALHDVKHAFDLWAAEIVAYYGQPDGRYIPRQAMRYDAIV